MALSITAYSTIDNRAVRLMSPVVYIACQFLGTALILTPPSLRDRTSLPADPSVIAGLYGSNLISSYFLLLSACACSPILALRQVGIAVCTDSGLVDSQRTPGLPCLVGFVEHRGRINFSNAQVTVTDRPHAR